MSTLYQLWIKDIISNPSNSSLVLHLSLLQCQWLPWAPGRWQLNPSVQGQWKWRTFQSRSTQGFDASASSSREASTAHGHASKILEALGNTLLPLFLQPGCPSPLISGQGGLASHTKWKRQKEERDERERNAVPSSDQWHPPAWGLVVNPVLSSKHGGNNSSPNWHKRANCYSLLFTLSRGHLIESNSNMVYSLHLENSAPT